MAERLRHIFTKPKETSEQEREEYLSSLLPEDRVNTERFLDFTRTLQEQLGETRIAVLAVGSSTEPANERSHPMEDIDLRLLNSDLSNSTERSLTIDKIRSGIRWFLNTQDVQFTEEDHTIREVKIPDQNSKELVSFLDWYNEDPSFVVEPIQGSPLHLSVSGNNNYPIDEYLRKETQRKTTTVILQK